MKKRVFLALFILLSLIVLPQSAVFAGSWGETRLGLGVGLFAAEPTSPNIALVFRTGPYDVKFAYDFTPGDGYIFLNGSYMAVNSRPLNDIFSGSLGLGAFAKYYFGEKRDDNFLGGINIPVSVEISFIDNFLQFFATIAPGLELFPKPQFTTNSLCAWIGFTILLD